MRTWIDVVDAKLGLNLSHPHDMLSIAKHLYRPMIQDRFGSAGSREHKGSTERRAVAGMRPGMAGHAPSRGKVVVGEGPVRGTGFRDFRALSGWFTLFRAREAAHLLRSRR